MANSANPGNWFKNSDRVLKGAVPRVEIIPSVAGAAGTVAGWINTAGFATLPQSQTSSLYNIPVNVNVGDTIKSFKVIGQIDSAGNTATLDAELFKRTEAAAGGTTASLGAITQVSATADTLVGSSKTLATAEKVAAGESFFVRLTGTTAATTDIEIAAIEVTFG